ncbi:MAG: Eco57I restriction-modification methylase domain-containing protein [Saprospiraceae bacterium]|nr:Eco57I restriction-modification methylase domain-containing protein [Saprospiraceae bacterium]
MMQTNYNPDVLSCLANLSNDEVFTPPGLVNDILDLLPMELWSNPDAKFLDPVCKSGVFLREMAKRLMSGLESKIPDKQERINHIFKNQLYGIAITELTSLLSRRSVYCSKTANGKYSICETFDDEQGNLRYDRMQHTWRNGKCTYCGASQEVYDREDALETYAYNFIHFDHPEEIFNMKFDVIVGNPPYQLNDGGGTGSSAKPIYHLFINQAKKLNPRYLSMIIPARWYSGGKGLDEFRSETLKDKSIRKLVDFADSRDCFPGVDIAGGVCYFLWDRDNKGICEVETIRKNIVIKSKRFLDEFDTFVRDNLAIDIIHKVKQKSNSFLDEAVSSRMPFGLVSSVRPEKTGDLELITSKGKGKIHLNKITSGKNLIDKWKVLLSKASNDHGGQPDKEGKRRIFSRIEVMPPNTVCTESYLVVGSFSNEYEALNMAEFLRTKFCRFLVSTILLTQNITKGKFIFVPNLSMNEKWDDEKLFAKYELTQHEIEFISQLIRPINSIENDL